MNDETPSPPEPEYKVVVTGPGMSVERPITETVALSILSVVMGGGRAPTVRSAGDHDDDAARPQRGSGGLGSEGEFLEESGAKKNFEKITALGFYIEDEIGQDSFTRNDVREAFERAREPMPGNFARDFAIAIEAKWIAEIRGSSDQFHVTTTGRKAVVAQFSKDVTASRPRRRRRSKASTNGEEKAAE
jgi:hypothetical protein